MMCKTLWGPYFFADLSTPRLFGENVSIPQEESTQPDFILGCVAYTLDRSGLQLLIQGVLNLNLMSRKNTQ